MGRKTLTLSPTDSITVGEATIHFADWKGRRVVLRIEAPAHVKIAHHPGRQEGKLGRPPKHERE